MREFRSGIGLLAQNLNIPVLPMRIDGLFEFKKAGKKFAPPWKIQVRIGKPMTFLQKKRSERDCCGAAKCGRTTLTLQPNNSSLTYDIIPR